MKHQLNRMALKRAIAASYKAADVKSPKAHLGWCEISDSDSGVTFRVTDSADWRTQTLYTQADVEGEAAATTVSVKLLRDVAKSLTKGAWTAVEVGTGGVALDGTLVPLVTGDLEELLDYPEPDWQGADSRMLWDSQELRAAIRKTLPAVSSEESRFQICGALITAERIAATDGHRLHIAPVESVRHLVDPEGAHSEGSKTPTEGPGELVPRFILADLLSPCFTLKKSEEPAGAVVGLEVTEHHYRIRYGDQNGTCEWQGARMEGTFPDIDSVVVDHAGNPDHYSADVNSAELRTFCERLLPFCGERTQAIRTTWNGRLDGFAADPSRKVEGSATAKTTVLHSPDHGEDIVSGINPAYMIDAGVLGDVLTWTLIDQNSQVVARAPDGSIGVVMPIRL